MMVKDLESDYTRYQIWKLWRERVRKITVLGWRDIVYPMNIRKTGVVDIGALVALVLWIAMIGVGIMVVYPMLVRIYEWLAKIF